MNRIKSYFIVFCLAINFFLTFGFIDKAFAPPPAGCCASDRQSQITPPMIMPPPRPSIFIKYKWSSGDIVKVFAVEIILITTISSFFGYILMILFLKSLQAEVTSILTYIAFPAYVVVLGGVLLYLTNLFSGLLPVVLLLQKTPSQITKKYDL